MLTAGMARMRHTLQALQARAQAAMALADKGPASLVQTLTGLLPPLANSGMSFCLPFSTLFVPAFIPASLVSALQRQRLEYMWQPYP